MARDRKGRALPAVAAAANATEAAAIEGTRLLNDVRKFGVDCQFFKRDGGLVVRWEIAQTVIEPKEALDGMETLGMILKGIFS